MKKGRKRALTIVMYILSLTIFGTASIFSWVSYFDQYEIAAIIDRNIVVTAAITTVRHVSGHRLSSGRWGIWYEYIDEDGAYYGGIYKEYNIADRAQADAQIGKKVKIYIDGKGKISFPIRVKPAFMRQMTIAIILSILTVGAVSFITIREIFLIKDRILLKKIRGNGS